jgi:hypothetical protein
MCIIRSPEQEHDLLNSEHNLLARMSYSITLCALKGFLSSVSLHVHLQDVWPRKLLITLCAQKAFLPSVRSHVFVQIMFCQERLITLYALKRFLSSVSLNVHLQMT